MNQPFPPQTMLRSSREKLGGYVILPRLIDKVRLHEKKSSGRLNSEIQKWIVFGIILDEGGAFGQIGIEHYL